MNIQTLSRAALATAPSDRMSDKYNFLRTSDIVGEMENAGFYVAASTQQNGKRFVDTGVHLVRMRHERYLGVKELVPEVVIRNSHNGRRALSLSAGLFRMICSNGLVVGTENASIIMRHKGGNTMDAVFDGVRWVTEVAENAMQAQTAWSQRVLTDAERIGFAQQAGMLFRKDKDAFDVQSLFAAKYDEPDNLWTDFNLAQERLIGGGALTGKGRKTQAINNAGTLIELNRGLWSIAEKMAA